MGPRAGLRCRAPGLWGLWGSAPLGASRPAARPRGGLEVTREGRRRGRGAAERRAAAAGFPDSPPGPRALRAETSPAPRLSPGAPLRPSHLLASAHCSSYDPDPNPNLEAGRGTPAPHPGNERCGSRRRARPRGGRGGARRDSPAGGVGGTRGGRGHCGDWAGAPEVRWGPQNSRPLGARKRPSLSCVFPALGPQ